jgi:hypothetical protein
MMLRLLLLTLMLMANHEPYHVMVVVMVKVANFLSHNNIADMQYTKFPVMLG